MSVFKNMEWGRGVQGPLALVLYLILFAPSLSAYEVDNFTRRDEIIEESRAVLNREVIRRMDEAISRANTEMTTWLRHERCDATSRSEVKAVRSRLFAAMLDQLQSGAVTRTGLEDFAENSDQLNSKMRLKVAKKESVYRNSEMLILSNIDLASVIQMGGVHLGTDKLGHFFDQGFQYYEARNVGDEMLVRQTGGNFERNEFGKSTTGVYSFADLAANYDGYLFWRRVLGEGVQSCQASSEEVGDAVLLEAKNQIFITRGGYRQSVKPYICCEDGRFKRNPMAKFDFAEYVSPAWDESINCSRFTASLEETVRTNLKSVVMANGKKVPMTCPVDANLCKGLNLRYGGLAVSDHILHDDCLCQDVPMAKRCSPALVNSSPNGSR